MIMIIFVFVGATRVITARSSSRPPAFLPLRSGHVEWLQFVSLGGASERLCLRAASPPANLPTSLSGAGLAVAPQSAAGPAGKRCIPRGTRMPLQCLLYICNFTRPPLLPPTTLGVQAMCGVWRTLSIHAPVSR
jgi:hypothetical protein